MFSVFCTQEIAVLFLCWDIDYDILHDILHTLNMTDFSSFRSLQAREDMHINCINLVVTVLSE